MIGFEKLDQSHSGILTGGGLVKQIRCRIGYGWSTVFKRLFVNQGIFAENQIIVVVLDIVVRSCSRQFKVQL